MADTFSTDRRNKPAARRGDADASRAAARATSSGHPPESMARKTHPQSASAVSSSTRPAAARACAMALIAISPVTFTFGFRVRSSFDPSCPKKIDASDRRSEPRPGSSRRAMTPQRSTCNAQASAWGASSLAMPPGPSSASAMAPYTCDVIPTSNRAGTDLPLSNDFADTRAVNRTIAAAKPWRALRPSAPGDRHASRNALTKHVSIVSVHRRSTPAPSRSSGAAAAAVAAAALAAAKAALDSVSPPPALPRINPPNNPPPEDEERLWCVGFLLFLLFPPPPPDPPIFVGVSSSAPTAASYTAVSSPSPPPPPPPPFDPSGATRVACVCSEGYSLAAASAPSALAAHPRVSSSPSSSAPRSKSRISSAADRSPGLPDPPRADRPPSSPQSPDPPGVDASAPAAAHAAACTVRPAPGMSRSRSPVRSANENASRAQL